MNSFFPSEPVANEQSCACEQPPPQRESPIYKALVECENSQKRLATALAELLTRLEPVSTILPPSPDRKEMNRDQLVASSVTGRINKITEVMRAMTAKIHERARILEL